MKKKRKIVFRDEVHRIMNGMFECCLELSGEYGRLKREKEGYMREYNLIVGITGI